ncbi:MAG: RHS repeat-associated core domain-containing protein, partial [Lachnospiraceae bacterium]|nr:RHS repeat-associated core domain-containing protein [Lachnospiraceae bacterium]
ELIPLYDNENSVCGIIYENATYYFQKNLQGDVIALVDANAQVAARYTYDAWGKVTGVKTKDGTAITSSTHVANINPFRYRGYYLDRETGLYYLQSRYYDPVVGRFVNGDMAETLFFTDGIFENNLFVYCNNNSVGFFDIYGYKAWYIHFAHAVSEITGLAGTFIAVGKAMPIAKKLIFATLSYTIKITGITGQLAACLTAIVTLIALLLFIKSVYDLARVFFGTCKYIIQEIKYALNPWHEHKSTDLSGPDFDNAFGGW